MSLVAATLNKPGYDDMNDIFVESASINRLEGELKRDEPMHKHTSWRVGGPADYYYKPKNIDDVAKFLSLLRADVSIHWVGLGSNLLVRDGGIRGVVIATSGLLNQLSYLGDDVFRAEAGVSCAKVARLAAKQQHQGAEFLAGIPGTVGGALAMNAGAFGGETWGKVIAVETLNKKGQRFVRKPAEYKIGYRSVIGPKDEWFVAAHFEFARGDGELALERIKKLLNKRNETQPTNLPSCGSVFRNPENDFAARLIEQTGLKGYCIGGACVSEKHANFIVNAGNARAEDIESLIEYVAQAVFDKHGVKLVREAHIIGERIYD